MKDKRRIAYVTGGWLDEVPSIVQTALMDTRAQRSFYGPKIVRCCWPAWKQLASGVAARSHTTSWRICCCAHLTDATKYGTCLHTVHLRLALFPSLVIIPPRVDTHGEYSTCHQWNIVQWKNSLVIRVIMKAVHIFAPLSSLWYFPNSSWPLRKSK